jgi:DNA (cytosine-5)-methyltransferase 1
MSSIRYELTAIDLFAGAGGATEGLRRAGFHVVAAVENDPAAAASLHRNHPRTLLDSRDIRKVDPVELRRKLHLRRGQLTLLKSCPPCQGYSSLRLGNKSDPRNDLILLTSKFVEAFFPKVILLENVPGLRYDARLRKLIHRLTQAKYHVETYLVDARDFGVPQRRKRLILLATRVRTKLPELLTGELLPGFGRGAPTLRSIFRYATTRAARKDPLHRGRGLSGEVIARIRAIPVNGNRFDLPAHLSLACHASLGRQAVASYGRISIKGNCAPTMTTRCTSPSCGSFIHPRANRAITLREAALIQTFPRRYVFCGNYGDVERQIGNAVPVRMAKALGLIAKRFALRAAS